MRVWKESNYNDERQFIEQLAVAARTPRFKRAGRDTIDVSVSLENKGETPGSTSYAFKAYFDSRVRGNGVDRVSFSDPSLYIHQREELEGDLRDYLDERVNQLRNNFKSICPELHVTDYDSGFGVLSIFTEILGKRESA